MSGVCAGLVDGTQDLKETCGTRSLCLGPSFHHPSSNLRRRHLWRF